MLAIRRRERERDRRIRTKFELSAPLVEELRAAGFDIETVSDLYNRPIDYKDYKEAIPILLRWLPEADPAIKESIVRALSVRWARPVAARAMIEEFRRAKEIGDEALAWAVGNAINVVADKTHIEDLLELVSDRSYGSARQMVVLALGRWRDSRIAPVLVALLDDPEVNGHVLSALRQSKVSVPREAVEPFLEDRRAWVRRSAKVLLDRLGDTE